MFFEWNRKLWSYFLLLLNIAKTETMDQFPVHLMMVHLQKWLTCSIMAVLSCWAIRYWSKIKLIRGSSEGDVSTWEKSWSGTIALICGVEGAIVITAFLRRCCMSHALGFWWPGMEGGLRRQRVWTCNFTVCIWISPLSLTYNPNYYVSWKRRLVLKNRNGSTSFKLWNAIAKQTGSNVTTLTNCTLEFQN